MFFGQQDDLRTKDPGTVKLRDAAIVTERRRERCRVSAGTKIKKVCVGVCQIDIARMGTLDALGCPRRAAGVEQ